MTSPVCYGASVADRFDLLTIALLVFFIALVGLVAFMLALPIILA